MAAREFDEYLNRFYSDRHPELGSGPLSIEPYVSPTHFEQERTHIFRKAWLLVCHESEIPDPGDFLVKRVRTFNASIILLRGNDGQVRAFHNVCRHRGNRLTCEEQGHTQALFCRFHGWTYALDGRLRGLPEQDRFPGINKAEHGLVPVPIETWKGHVFIRWEPQSAMSLREYLGTLGDALDAYPFEQMRLLTHHRATLRTNWKVAINAFQEAYHVPTVHALSARTLFVSRLADFRFHGPHQSMTLPLSPNFQPKPVEVLSSQFTRGMSQDAVAVDRTGRFPGTNPCDTPNYSFDINVVFPSSFIDVGEGYYFTYEFWPVAVNETDFVLKVFSLPATTWSQRLAQELSIIFLREGVAEDLSTVESTQEGLESGAIESMVLSDQEIAIRHQHHVIRNLLRSRNGA